MIPSTFLILQQISSYYVTILNLIILMLFCSSDQNTQSVKIPIENTWSSFQITRCKKTKPSSSIPISDMIRLNTNVINWFFSIVVGLPRINLLYNHSKHDTLNNIMIMVSISCLLEIYISNCQKWSTNKMVNSLALELQQDWFNTGKRNDYVVGHHIHEHIIYTASRCQRVANDALRGTFDCPYVNIQIQ